jgi:hypothetical protein
MRSAPEAAGQIMAANALAMAGRAERTRFEALLLGAKAYLDGGGDPPRSARTHTANRPADARMVRRNAADPIFHSNVVLGPVQPNWIAVGIEGWYDALEPIVWTYSADASQTYFLYPKTLSPTAPPRGPAMLVMTFDRAGLEHAAASATRSEWAEVHSVAAACGGGR